MKFRSASRDFLLGSITAFFLSMAVLPAFAATAPQFASYSISGNVRGHSFYAVVNESVAPSSASGMSDVTMQITSAMGNLSYSKIVNSTQVILPYFPTIANQSISYQFHNYSITATINQAGSGSASYNAKTYALSNYTFDINVSGKSQTSASGSASVFPSGLVYSASVVANGTDTLNIQLLSTNLPLNSQAGSSQNTNTSIAVAGGAGSVLVGVGAFVVYRRRSPGHAESAEAKPLHHVD